MNALSKNSGGMFFQYGHGGNGKTFIWNTLSATVRFEKGIVINVASSAGDYNDGEASIEIPENMLIRDSEDAFSELLQFVYPDLLNNIANHDLFQGRAILGPTNESVIYVNDYLSSLIEEEEKVYLSSKSLCVDEAGSEIKAKIYSTEFLNTISCSGLPPHKLLLKKGVHVMLIRNLNQARGLSNGTRL
ncbi:PREDICTED: uncharacterized protein LOC105966417 [Erythranthe guttata]|uniref:uncharacterized protein LOC105966417 n=1 Tax=Erythranthe guttata TaxID=4155 RepID=UPI00064DB452|nr:PREDICTED: uncharacterized protein LOC105966417 [Erythranthe guttata]|eukprot:XP_012846425.1 PREDICTED: uncharacterized protein LOC105966417 [Erythranthe guttata]